jgi:hypothetical protein
MEENSKLGLTNVQNAHVSKTLSRVTKHLKIHLALLAAFVRLNCFACITLLPIGNHL